MQRAIASFRRRIKGTSLRTYSPLASWLLLLPLLILSGVAFIVPIAKFLLTSFGEHGFTLAQYHILFTKALYLKILLRTLYISLLVSAIALMLGYPVAYMLTKLAGWKRGLVALSVFIPLWTSVLVRSYIWTILLQRNGIVNSFLQWIGLIKEPLDLLYTEGAVILAMTHVLLPYMILPIFNVAVGIPRELPLAAQNLGAGPAASFRYVILPLTLPGIAAGFLMTFILSLGFFITPALVGGAQSLMIATLIQQQVTTLLNWPFSAALSVVLLIMTLLLAMIFQRVFNVNKVLRHDG